MPVPIEAVDPQWAWSPYQPDDQRPWTRELAAHLYRRAGFGADSRQLADAQGQAPGELVRSLLDAAESEDYASEVADLAAAARATGNVQRAGAWWLHKMLTSPAQAAEKLTLFWHGHFATGAEKVEDIDLMLAQNSLLREHALGSFGKMVHGISRDPAMLIYLDSATNRRAHPNENYARELMELFCLGEGNYTEQDVQQLARCFTGWEVRRKRFRFNRYQHDEDEKQILGQTGEFSGEEAVDIVLQQPSLEQFICGKLVRYYVMDEPAASAELLEPLARTFREADLQVRPVVEQILCSNLFFSPHAVAHKIRSPIELVVGMLRSLEGSTNVVELAEQLHQLGHGLFYPPNVKGWDGGRTWINTSTLLGRANLVRDVIRNESTRFQRGTLEDLARQAGATSVPQAVDWLCQLLVAVPLDESVRQHLQQAAGEGGGLDEQLKRTLYALATTPEFQLC